jgi:hypothetical protein
MLITAIVLTAMILIFTNLIAHRLKNPTVWIALPSVLALLMVLGFPLFFPTVALMLVFLLVALVVWRNSSRGPSYFTKLSIAATLLAFGLVGGHACWAEREYARLRKLYPYESMETRLPVPRAELRATPAVLARLDNSEEWDRKSYWSYSRSEQLRRLHEDAVGLFVERFGFGVFRMPPPFPNEGRLNLFDRDVPDILQPGPRIAPPQSPGEWLRMASGEEPLGRLHELGIQDFASARGFGFFKDRRHVAGFVPHRFTEVPVEDPKKWKVGTLDLVGLLMADEPRVYLSANLPRMGELRSAPTRPLDKFEAAGPATIRSGDDLLVVRDGSAIRMLGAIRSRTQCVDCHGGERGDLLGAFTYTLRPDETAGPNPPPVGNVQLQPTSRPLF